MAIFPSQRFANGAPWAKLFTDAKLTQSASITDLNGKPVPQNLLVAQGNSWPLFQFAGSGPLYYRLPDGTIDELLPSVSHAPTTITGSRGTQTAAVLASLLSALNTQGVIVDNTTA